MYQARIRADARNLQREKSSNKPEKSLSEEAERVRDFNARRNRRDVVDDALMELLQGTKTGVD